MQRTHGIASTRIFAATLLVLCGASLSTAATLRQQVHHDLQVVVQPQKKHLQVADTITLPKGGPTTWHFQLHAGLAAATSTLGVRLERQPMPPGAISLRPPLETYTVVLPPGVHTFVVRYQGPIFHPVQTPRAEQARGFGETPGLISAKGVYLQAATRWYPVFANTSLTFTLDVKLPQGWDAVSQGKRTHHARLPDHTRVRWAITHPQEEIFLTAAPFTTYSQPAGAVQAMAFLRTPDAALAQQYLGATAPYLAMYNDLIGPYPYAKFALVENFWETGYGMPSFTLLGSKVIRLPFIPHSSYPHEILHNWWGNGVYVDATGGNWSEGLTAYLADHLLKEQRGDAAAYRRTALQKYTDYVRTGRDFPLATFRARHDPVTEAVGYGKAMMVFHMLRLQLGDDDFTQGLRTLYQRYRFRRTNFTDVLQAFASGPELQTAYRQWLDHPGAPELRLRDPRVQAKGTAYVLTATIEQTQIGPPYNLRLPIAVTLEGQANAAQQTVVMPNKRLKLTLRLPARPLRLDLDPEFDVFRRLHHEEIPPALTQMFGAADALIVLPAAAPETLRQGYRHLAETWKRNASGSVHIRWDTDLTTLPTDRVTWLFGWENLLRPRLAKTTANYDLAMHTNRVRIGQTTLTHDTHTVVVTTRHPSSPQTTVAWLATNNPTALPGLERKLPHYGKYSYLGFSGDAPTNVAKGQWPVTHSPLSVLLSRASGRTAQVARATLAPRQPLASLPAAFPADRMQRIIRTLAGNAMRGRGFGSPELDRAATFIADQFRAAGLQPAGDAPGSYFQTWQTRGGEPARDVELKNIVGVIPGKNRSWVKQSVVVGAHYDHLGLGWPGARQQETGMLHPGADDNASGVAVLVELVHALAKSWQPERSVVFVAFSGEEAGRLGSQHYVAHAARWPAAQAIGMLNFDGVGRLEQRPLRILGTASASEWPHIFRGAGHIAGVRIAPVAQEWGSSDQRSFLDAGIPAVQLFSGIHLDYHRPTDTVDKIDPAGLIKVAAVAREAIVHLAGRDTPLTATVSPTPGQSTEQAGAPVVRRRVSLGTVPDFAHAGPGYRISDVTPDSPAAHAGLRAGDVITRVGTTAIADIRTFVTVLKALQPGDTVDITFQRGTAEQTVQAQLASR